MDAAMNKWDYNSRNGITPPGRSKDIQDKIKSGMLDRAKASAAAAAAPAPAKKKTNPYVAASSILSPEDAEKFKAAYDMVNSYMRRDAGPSSTTPWQDAAPKISASRSRYATPVIEDGKGEEDEEEEAKVAASEEAPVRIRRAPTGHVLGVEPTGRRFVDDTGVVQASFDVIHSNASYIKIPSWIGSEGYTTQGRYLPGSSDATVSAGAEIGPGGRFKLPTYRGDGPSMADNGSHDPQIHFKCPPRDKFPHFMHETAYESLVEASMHPVSASVKVPRRVLQLHYPPGRYKAPH